MSLVLKHLVYVSFLVIMAMFSINCSNLNFAGPLLGKSDSSNGDTPPISDNGNNNSQDDNSTPDPDNDDTPQVPQKVHCNFLLDETGIYFQFGQNSNYVAIQGVTECAFNEINHIEGPCSNETTVTVLRPDQAGNTINDDLTLPPNNTVTIAPGTNKTFICAAFFGTTQGVVISSQYAKLIIVQKNNGSADPEPEPDL